MVAARASTSSACPTMPVSVADPAHRAAALLAYHAALERGNDVDKPRESRQVRAVE